MNTARVTLKPKRERPVIQGSPWVFSGAIATIDGYEANGQPCDIFSSDGKYLATGYVNRESKITCRILTHDQIPVDAEFIRHRIRQAIIRRADILTDDTDSCRLVNSEGDFLPGLIIDKYAAGTVVQILTSGMELFRDTIISALEEFLSPEFIVERSDISARSDEGLPQRSGIIQGNAGDKIEIREHGLRYLVDVLSGQKTGFFLDQRDSRFMVRRYANGKTVANLFSYSGGFSVSAAQAGATRVLSVDASAPALELARRNMELNNLGHVPADCVKADVFEWLGNTQDKWDIIVLDPPAFATKKAAVERAARGYKDLTMRALKLLEPGGILFTFSCSHHISPELFKKIVFAATADAGVDAQVVARTGHPADHPFNVCHMEGEYLKGLVLRLNA